MDWQDDVGIVCPPPHEASKGGRQCVRDSQQGAGKQAESGNTPSEWQE